MKSKRFLLVLLLVLLMSLMIAGAALASPEVMADEVLPVIQSRFGLVGN
jgi:hypothetical protein